MHLTAKYLKTTEMALFSAFPVFFQQFVIIGSRWTVPIPRPQNLCLTTKLGHTHPSCAHVLTSYYILFGVLF